MDTKTKNSYLQRLRDATPEWREQVNMDRVIILTFLTAGEKAAASTRLFGDPEVVWLDGAMVTEVVLDPAAHEEMTYDAPAALVRPKKRRATTAQPAAAPLPPRGPRPRGLRRPRRRRV